MIITRDEAFKLEQECLLVLQQGMVNFMGR